MHVGPRARPACGAPSRMTQIQYCYTFLHVSSGVVFGRLSACPRARARLTDHHTPACMTAHLTPPKRDDPETFDSNDPSRNIDDIDYPPVVTLPPPYSVYTLRQKWCITFLVSFAGMLRYPLTECGRQNAADVDALRTVLLLPTFSFPSYQRSRKI